MLDAQPATVYPASPDDTPRNLKFGFWSEVGTSLHLFPDHCFVDNCRRQDEICPDMSTKKSVLDDRTINREFWTIFMPPHPHRRCRRHYVSGLSVRPSGCPSRCPSGFFRLRDNSSITWWNFIKLGQKVKLDVTINWLDFGWDPPNVKGQRSMTLV